MLASNQTSLTTRYLWLIVVLTFLSYPIMATTIAEQILDNHELMQSGGGKLVNADKQEKATPLARALAQSSSKLEQAGNKATFKTLTLKVTELTDNQGLMYIGGKVSRAELTPYLNQLKDILGKEAFTIYRQNQAARDHHTFHVTLINPYEYQKINKKNIHLSQPFQVTLHGLGHVEKGDKNTYFVVASSAQGQFLRQGFLLKNKGFHVTLGFSPTDIYGVSKGRDRLIQK